MADLSTEIKRLEAELAQAPDSVVYFPLARLYFSSNEGKKAFDICYQGLKKHPQFYDGYILLGEILTSINQTERAEKAFATAFKLDPSRSDPLFLLCDLYIHTGNLAKLTAVMHQLEIVAPYDMRLQRIRETVGSMKKDQRKKAVDTPPPLPKTDAFRGNKVDVDKVIEDKPDVQNRIKDKTQVLKKKEVPKNFDFDSFREKLFEIEGVTGMVFINPDGQVLRSMESDLNAAKSMAKIMKSYAKAFNLSFDVLNFGDWIEVTIILEEGFVFILNLEKYKIGFQCSEEISLGSLRARLRNILIEFNLISRT